MPEQANIVDSSETRSYSSPDDSGSIEEIVPEGTILSRQASMNLIPFLGQRFISQDAAYEFYFGFAKQCGFSIRRHRTRGKDGVGKGITRRDFTCHRGGYPQIKPTEDPKTQRNRKSSRCGCQAYMRIVKTADFEVPEWRVTGFHNVHNHELVKPNELRLLPVHCTMSADDKRRIYMYAKAGMSVRQMLRLMELEKGIKIGCLSFSEIDVRNLLQSFRNVERDIDPIDLVKMCKEKKDSDPYFRYDYKIDFDNRLEHIAWSYGSSIGLYKDFGDVVVFDTTRRLDAFDMILGFWIGVDNHGMYCLFGCLLLRDESVASFSWGLRMFLAFMNGKAPGTILTNQNTCLKEALAMDFPVTKHAFSIWHIVSKFFDWFSVILGSQYDNWKAEFHRLYNMHTVEEFEVGWREMVDIYGLHENKHIVSLYALRMYWALPFLRSNFFAGMSSTLHAESINNYIQQILSSSQCALDNFIERVALVLEQVGQNTKRSQKVHKACLTTGSPIESHASTVLTPYAFSKLQTELVWAPQHAMMLVDENCFIVRHHTEADGGFKVLWVPRDEFVTCSCRHFEFSGILCRHILRVLLANNCFHIPDRYLPSRWCELSPSPTKSQNRTSSSGKVMLLQSMMSALITESIETEGRLDVACNHIALVLARIKEFPVTDDDSISYNDSPAGSPILPDVENFSGNPHEGLSFTNLKGGRARDEVTVYGKKRRAGVPWCGEFVDEISDGRMVGDDDLKDTGLGFL